MAYNTISDLFKGICDAVRLKTGTSGLINHQDIPSKISSIQTSGSTPKYQTKIVDPQPEAFDVTADVGFDALSKVTVTAAPSGGTTPSGTIYITENKTHDVAKYAYANVNVPTSGGSGGTVTSVYEAEKHFDISDVRDSTNQSSIYEFTPKYTKDGKTVCFFPSDFDKITYYFIGGTFFVPTETFTANFTIGYSNLTTTGTNTCSITGFSLYYREGSFGKPIKTLSNMETFQYTFEKDTKYFIHIEYTGTREDFYYYEWDSYVKFEVEEQASSGGSDISIQPNKTAIPTSSEQIIIPDSGFDALAQVTVAAIPPGGGGSSNIYELETNLDISDLWTLVNKPVIYYFPCNIYSLGSGYVHYFPSDFDKLTYPSDTTGVQRYFSHLLKHLRQDLQ